MFFLHIFDDFYLQGWLANGKCRKWWIENASDEKYKRDYTVALFMHAFSWSFMIMLPFAYLSHFNPNMIWRVLFFLNFLVHAFVDNLKANKGKINLMQDQTIHLVQITTTYLILTNI